uniref:Coiled-coil domain-containing protein 73 n=1 Tax=Leptobrachium leishanense TaxID=445787 RepID=A0A8C5QRV9_9ANUR
MNGTGLENAAFALQGPSDTLLSSQLFEFKTQLLEAVEELRIGRVAKIQYEEQISKILMEKQELAWQNESLSNEVQISDKRHKEALTALKKKLQIKMCVIEEEKGQFQLAAEAKEREITALKEEMKVLQEQKAEVHMAAKEDHMKQLSDFQKCFATISRQFEMANEAHEKLEQNVQEVIRQNEKLKAENNELKDSSHFLKEEINTLSVELKWYKKRSQERTEEEKSKLLEKDNQIKELQQKIQMEAEINKKLTEENTYLKEEKQVDMRSLQKMLQLIRRHTETILNLENQGMILRDRYQTLERDNELQRAKATENEEKFLALQSEHKNTWTLCRNQVQENRLDDDTDAEQMDTEVSRSDESLSQDQTGNMKNHLINYASTNTNLLQKRGKVIMENYVNEDKVPDDYQRGHEAYTCEEQKCAPSFKCDTPENVHNFKENTNLSDVESIEYAPRDGISSTENNDKEGSNVTSSPDRQTLDTNKFPPVSDEDKCLHRDSSSNHKSVDVTNKHVYSEIDMTCIEETGKAVHIRESKMIQELRERLAPNNVLSEATTACDGVIVSLNMDGNRNHGLFQRQGIAKLNDNVSCSNESSTQFKAEQMQLRKENPDSQCSDMRQCKETSTDEQSPVNTGNEEESARCLESGHNSNANCSSGFMGGDSPCVKRCVFSLEGLRYKNLNQQYDSPVLLLSEDHTSKELHSMPVASYPSVELHSSQQKEDDVITDHKTTNILNADLEMSQDMFNSASINMTTELRVDHGVSGNTLEKEMVRQGNDPHVDKERQLSQKLIGVNEGMTGYASFRESLDEPVYWTKDKCTVASDSDTVQIPVETSHHNEPAKFKGFPSMDDIDSQTLSTLECFPPKDKLLYKSTRKNNIPEVSHQNIFSKAELDCSITRRVGNISCTSHTSIGKDWTTPEHTVQDSCYSAVNCKAIGKLRCQNEGSKQTAVLSELPDSKDGGFPGTRVQDHISEIENFLTSQPLKGPKMRKIEVCVHKAEGKLKEHGIS